MAKKLREIIKKWYVELAFPEEYGQEFERLLSKYEALSEEEITREPFSEDGEKNLLSSLYLCELLEECYLQKGIARGILMDTLSDIVLWTQTHYELTGMLGLSETNWLKHHLSFQLFRLGRLQFCMGGCHSDIPDISVKKGDKVVEVHIPGGEALKQEECIKSIEKAKDFFEAFFPEYNYKCFTCHSWLLDDTLMQFLHESSNIIRFQKLFTPVCKEKSLDILKYTITWAADNMDIRELRPRNVFSEKILDYVQKGGDFYIVLGYIKNSPVGANGRNLRK